MQLSGQADTITQVSEVWTAIIGGTVGVLLGLLLAQLGRAALAWREVTDHDKLTEAENERLLIWVDDRTQRLVEEMRGINNRNATFGQQPSGSNGRQLAAAKSAALHEYRDQRQRVIDQLRALALTESPWHSLWRLLRPKHRRAPGLTVDDEAEPFLDRWREPVTRHSADPKDAVQVFDRTKRTPDVGRDELPSLKLT